MVISQTKSPFLTMSVPTLAKPAMSFIAWTWKPVVWFSLPKILLSCLFSIAYWRKKEISREYWALIEGRVESKELVFRDKIGRDRHDRRKRVVDPKSGQHAETQVSRLKQFPNQTTLVRCKLKTGRTHQIRVHLSHHKHPILGDPLYNSRSKVSRLMLHAFRLSFTHPLTLEQLSFTALSDTFETELKQNG